VLVSALNSSHSVNCIVLLEVPLTCSDGLLDGDETATDCGGSCAGCKLGSTCVRRDDCSDGSCQAGKCTRKCSEFCGKVTIRNDTSGMPCNEQSFRHNVKCKNHKIQGFRISFDRAVATSVHGFRTAFTGLSYR
jgi:hypothetical protein